MATVTTSDMEADLSALDGLVDGAAGEGIGLVLAPIRERVAGLARLLAAVEAHEHRGRGACCAKELKAALRAGEGGQ